MRVHVHHFELRDNEYVPFIATDESGVYREVALVAQPGSQEAFLAALEREVLLAGPRGTARRCARLSLFAEVGGVLGAEMKGIFIRQSMTGFPEIKSLCAKVIPRIWPNARFNQNQKPVDLAVRRDAQIGLFRRDLGLPHLYRPIVHLDRLRGAHPVQERPAIQTDAGLPAVADPEYPDPSAGHDQSRRPRPQLGASPLQNRRSKRYDGGAAHRRRARLAAPGDLFDARRKPTAAHHPTRLSRQHRCLGDTARPARGLDQGIVDDFVGWHVRWRLAGGVEALRAAPDPAGSDPLIVADHRGIRLGRRQAICLDLGGDQRRLPDRPSPAAACCAFIRGDYRHLRWNSTAVIRNQPDTGVRWSIDQIKRAGIAKEIDSGLRYQDPMTGQLDQARAHRRRRQHDLQPEAGQRHRRPCRQHGRRVRRVCHHRSRSPARRAAGNRPTKVPAAACKAGRLMRGMLLATDPEQERRVGRTPACSSPQNCVHWIQTVPVLPRDLDGNPEDIPDRVEDHLADATRYLIRRTNRPAIRSGRVRI